MWGCLYFSDIMAGFYFWWTHDWYAWPALVIVLVLWTQRQTWYSSQTSICAKNGYASELSLQTLLWACSGLERWTSECHWQAEHSFYKNNQIYSQRNFTWHISAEEGQSQQVTFLNKITQKTQICKIILLHSFIPQLWNENLMNSEISHTNILYIVAVNTVFRAISSIFRRLKLRPGSRLAHIWSKYSGLPSYI